MAAIERAIIIAALQHDAWEAASLLKITDKRLEGLIKKHKIVWPPKRQRASRGKATAKPAARAKPAKASRAKTRH